MTSPQARASVGRFAEGGAGRFAEQSDNALLVPASSVISALSYALDLTEGQSPGHSVQSCVIGMRLAQEIRLPVDDQANLYYALLLKDAGCSSNSSKLFHIIHADEIKAKGDLKDKDWTKVGWESLQYAIEHVATGAPFLERVRTLIRVAAKQQTESCELVKIRCERGASIARRMGFAEPVAAAIHSLDEHWNGGGYPDGLRGAEIPLFSRIMNLAQTLAVFLEQHGPKGAHRVLEQRAKRWFDPDLVKAAKSLAKTEALWEGWDDPKIMARVEALEPQEHKLIVSEDTLDNICLAFAEVIDAKSPFTFRHSNGVADAAVAIAGQLGMTDAEIVSIRRAALLHDIGKLSVPNSILEKPGKLTNEEWGVVKKHPFYTLEILQRVPGFEQLSDVAAAHHEKLDGSGYFRQWGAAQLNTPARILAVADVYDALAARRPYRDALPLETVFEIMHKEAPRALDAQCLEALETSKGYLSSSLAALAGNLEEAQSSAMLPAAAVEVNK
jgi:putative nucleotidyltransferase with HDIG domain